MKRRRDLRDKELELEVMRGITNIYAQKMLESIFSGMDTEPCAEQTASDGIMAFASKADIPSLSNWADMARLARQEH